MLARLPTTIRVSAYKLIIHKTKKVWWKKLLFILSLTFIGISCFCLSGRWEQYVTQKRLTIPLTAFAVAVNNVQAGTTSYYHGKIDQTTHKIEIRTIENANVITGVDYTLMDGQAFHQTPLPLYKTGRKSKGDCHHHPNNRSITYAIIVTTGMTKRWKTLSL